MILFKRLFSNSSLVPLAKIANATDRSIRILWAVFTATMVTGLLICISFVVSQYMQHQTAFQLDSTSEDYIYDQLPGVTICLSLASQKIISEQLKTKLNLTRFDLAHVVDKMKKKWLVDTNNTWTYKSKSYFLPEGTMEWNSETDAKSPVYGTFYNFKIKIDLMENKNKDRLFIIEQIPNEKMMVCTTFEFRPIINTHSWSSFRIIVEQNENQPVEITQPMIFTMIIHDRGELPFSAYDRFIYAEIRPDRDYSIYTSKTVIKMLNTKKNPCHSGHDAKSLDKTRNLTEYQGGMILMDELDRMRIDATDRKIIRFDEEHKNFDIKKPVKLFGTRYIYSRESCGWSNCCQTLLKECNAHCNLDTFGAEVSRLDSNCEMKQCREKPISYHVCPGTCVTSKYSKQNYIESVYKERRPEIVSCVNINKANKVEITVEEEIFTLAKLFSEIGGLCSLFIGFSSTFIFELIEGFLYLKFAKKIFRLNSNIYDQNENSHGDGEIMENFNEKENKLCENTTIPLLLSPSLNLTESPSGSEETVRVLPVLNDINQSFKKEDLLELLRNGQVKFQIKFSSQNR